MVDIGIDDAQPASIKQHFSKLINDKSVINSNHTEFTKDDLPNWFDKQLFEKGQKYYRRNVLTLGSAALTGLLAVLVVPSILRILIWTKKSGTPCTAFTRYLETLLHIHLLYTSDLENPNSKFWKSLNTIRYQHSASSRKAGRAGVGEITQRDMALTQFGFIGYALIVPEKLSLTNEPEEREGLNHFWRVIGHAIGISDSINICRKNAAETTNLCKELNEYVFVPNMKNYPEKFVEMSTALLDGMWCVDPFLDIDAFLYFWYYLSGITYNKPLGLYSKLNSLYRKLIYYLIRKRNIYVANNQGKQYRHRKMKGADSLFWYNRKNWVQLLSHVQLLAAGALSTDCMDSFW